MNTRLITLLSLFGLSAIAWANPSQPTKSEPNKALGEPLDRIIAVVDKQIIMQSEFNKEYKRVLSLLASKGGPIPKTEKLKREVAELLIVNKLQLERAEQMGIVVDDNQLNDTIVKIAQKHNKTLTQLRESIEKDGLSYREYREAMRQELRLKQVRQRAILSGIVVTDQEIDDFLSQNPIGNERARYRLRHLLISVDENASNKDIQAAKQTIDKLRKQAINGADFSELVRQHSDGQRAKNGGDLGWLPKQNIPSLFARSVDSLNDGDVSQPIRSPNGFHLIKQEASQGEQKRIIEQVRVRHILLKPDIVTTPERLRKDIMRLRERIVKGESFGTLAKTYSDDSGSAADGGEMGWTSPRLFVSEFRKAAETLPLNQLSQPIKTQFGWHILEVLERRKHDETAEFRRTIAQNEILEQKAKEEEALWVTRLRDSAYVEYYWDDIKPETTSAKRKDASELTDSEAKRLLDEDQLEQLGRIAPSSDEQWDYE